jgi:hypothetical protein
MINKFGAKCIAKKFDAVLFPVHVNKQGHQIAKHTRQDIIDLNNIALGQNTGAGGQHNSTVCKFMSYLVRINMAHGQSRHTRKNFEVS